MFCICPIYLGVTVKQKTQSKLFRFPLGIVRELEKAAAEAQVTQTTYLLQLLQRHFKRNPNDKN